MAKKTTKPEPTQEVETIETTLTPEAFLQSKGINPAIKESPLTLPNYYTLVELLIEFKHHEILH